MKKQKFKIKSILSFKISKKGYRNINLIQKTLIYKKQDKKELVILKQKDSNLQKINFREYKFLNQVRIKYKQKTVTHQITLTTAKGKQFLIEILLNHKALEKQTLTRM